ncbi:MAG: segregation/condensation protein A [Spirochaetales bacterium]|nr:segregation/condensation protein A [Spirochaetales bacterium]
MDHPDNRDKQLFKIGEFEGPLDLLLFLIRKSELNIYDIPIAEITAQYLEYLKYATKINLDNITEFFVMASTLLHIKSQMLLPVDVEMDDDYTDPRAELVDRLIEYQKFKMISPMIAEKGREADRFFDQKQRVLPFPDDEHLWTQVEVWDLLKTFSSLMASLSAERIIDLFEEVTINEKLTLIVEKVERHGEFLFTDLLTRSGSIMDIVCAFLAVLESVKRRQIAVYQNRMFGDIRIRSLIVAEGVL